MKWKGGWTYLVDIGLVDVEERKKEKVRGAWSFILAGVTHSSTVATTLNVNLLYSSLTSSISGVLEVLWANEVYGKLVRHAEELSGRGF